MSVCFEVVSADIQNLNLSNVNVTGNLIVGGLAGIAELANINNVHIDGNVTSTVLTDEALTGGLIGWADTGVVISNVTSNVNVFAVGDMVGGLIGGVSSRDPLSNMEIINSHSSGSVVTLGSRVGGLIGTTGDIFGSLAVDDISIIDSSSSANVVAGGQGAISLNFNGSAGGLIGRSIAGTVVTNSSSSGNVSGDGVNYLVENYGGLIGEAIDTVINNSSSTSKVSILGDSAGGLVGYALNTSITQSNSSGDVIAGNMDPSDKARS